MQVEEEVGREVGRRAEELVCFICGTRCMHHSLRERAITDSVRPKEPRREEGFV